MKISSMENRVEKNTWNVTVMHDDKLYTLIMQFDGYQLQRTTIVSPDGSEARYTSVVKMPSEFRKVVVDTIHKDTLVKTKMLEE